MSKKRKVTLTLAAILVALGGGAQFYTNQQVDRVLQKFPYSLDNQLSLHVTETGNHFFSRDLTFSLENSEGKRTEVISTKLTALPFFITAESQLSEQLVRQLNKNLNITLDKNTINSKFSPVGDYLQSDLVAEFRDFTNKTQTLSVLFNFDPSSKNIKVKSTLSGFNYDKNSKLEQLQGHAQLQRVDDNEYAIQLLELNAKQVEVDLLNGENTKIQLKNAAYRLDVKPHPETQQRDLLTQLNSETFQITDKVHKSEENPTMVRGLSLNLEQQGVQSAVDFASEFNALNKQPSVKNAVNFAIGVLTHNDRFNGSLSVKSIEVPKDQQPYFSLKDTAFQLELNNTDLAKAGITLQLKAADVKQTPAEPTKQWQLSGADIRYQLDDYPLQNEFAFIPFYLEALATKTPPKEASQALSALRDKWVKSMEDKAHWEMTLKAFRYGDVALEALAVNGDAKVENQHYYGTSHLSLKTLALPDLQVQLEGLQINMPMVLNNYPQLAITQFCMGMHSLLCTAYFSPESYKKMFDDLWATLDLSTEGTTVALNLNTYPTTKAYPVNLALKGAASVPQESKKSAGLFKQNLKGKMTFSFDKALLDDTQEAASKIKKNSMFWQSWQTELKPEGKLIPLFTELDGKYVMTLEKDKEWLVNGKTLEAIRQERLAQAEAERKAAAEQEAIEQEAVQKAEQHETNTPAVLEESNKADETTNPPAVAREATKDSAALQDSGKPEVKEHSTNESAVQENPVKKDVVQKSERVETHKENVEMSKEKEVNKGKDINKEK